MIYLVAFLVHYDLSIIIFDKLLSSVLSFVNLLFAVYFFLQSFTNLLYKHLHLDLNSCKQI